MSEEVVCPICRKVRDVSHHEWLNLQRHPHPCRSCSRKKVRSNMKFKMIPCQECGKVFARISGATKTCPACKAPPPPKICPVCGSRYDGYSNKTACSNACRRRIRNNEAYFGGNYFKAEGWAEKTCQVCGRHVEKGGSVHHVLGHPNHDFLVYICQGCHHLIGILAGRTNLDLQYLVLLSLWQRSGHERWTVSLKVEEYDEEEWTGARDLGVIIEPPRV